MRCNRNGVPAAQVPPSPGAAPQQLATRPRAARDLEDRLAITSAVPGSPPIQGRPARRLARTSGHGGGRYLHATMVESVSGARWWLIRCVTGQPRSRALAARSAYASFSCR